MFIFISAKIKDIQSVKEVGIRTMSAFLVILDIFRAGGQLSHKQCITANKEKIYTTTAKKT